MIFDAQAHTMTPVTHSAEDVARLLQLEPLDQEGGYFRRTMEGDVGLVGGRRSYSVIYSLITPEGFSAMHRLASDELWFFHAGDAVESLRLDATGHGAWEKLGLAMAAGGKPQSRVAAGTWQGTRLVSGGQWALLSCVVVPEFTWSDFELGDRARLQAAYPAFAAEIAALTREKPVNGVR